MTYVDRDISDQELLNVIRVWINLLAKQRYNEFFAALGYSMGGDEAQSDWITSNLARYRSDLYPEVTEFVVSQCEKTFGGNPSPRAEVLWYQPNESCLAGAVTFSLPLNGKWSDATADFVLFETNAEEGLLLKLEEICV